MALDVRTILIVIAIVCVTNAIAMLLGWRAYLRQRQMVWWLTSSVCLALGVTLTMLRGAVPEVVPVIFGNLFVLLAVWSMYVGCRVAVDLPSAWRRGVTVVAAVMAVQLFFFVVVPSLPVRTVLMAAVQALFALLSSLVLFSGYGVRTTSARRTAAVLLGLLALSMVVRGGVSLQNGSPAMLLRMNVGMAFNLTFALMLWLLLSYVFMVMTGERLQAEAQQARLDLDTQTQSGVQALRESEERFTLAVEGSSTGIWDWDVTSDSFFISALGKSLFGYADHEAAASYTEWRTRVHPDDLPSVVASIRRYLKSDETHFLLEHRLRHRDGSYRWIRSRGAGRRDVTQRVYRIAGSIEDFTAERQAVDAQAFLARQAHVGAREEFFESLVRYLTTALDVDAAFIDRLSSDGLLAHGEAACIGGRLAPLGIRAVQDTVMATFDVDGTQVLETSVREQFPADERMRGLEAESYAGITLRNSSGQPIGLLSVVARTPFRDASSHEGLLRLFALPAAGELVRKQADEALRVREEYSRTLLASLPAGVVVHAPDTTILDCNTMACELLGLSIDQMLGKTAIDPQWAFVSEQRTPLPVADFPVNQVARTRQPLKGFVLGLNVPARDEITWAVANAYPIRDGAGQLIQIVVTFVDVTERFRSEEARALLETQLRQSQKMEAVGQLAGGIAHDFNNLLTVITGIADVAARGLGADNPVRLDLLDIQRAGQRAAVLTRQLLAFGRKQNIAPEVLDLRSLIEGMQPLLTRVIREDIKLVLEPGAPNGDVLADPGQIEQVLLNLALNARDAMPQGGTLRFALADVTLDEAFARTHPGVRPGPHVRITVRDTGMGMDDATRARIFEPFYTTKEPGQGTGLGLATVYGIVSQSRGALDVSSTLGGGSTFSVFLPVFLPAVDVNDGAPKRMQTPRDVDTTMLARMDDDTPRTGSVLVVEDEPAIRRLAQRILESAGYTVLTACDGVDALRVLTARGAPVDLLLTDVIMPNMGGPELASRISALHPQTKVLFASGYAGDADLRLDELGASGNFLGKPYQVVELVHRVDEMMAQKG